MADDIESQIKSAILSRTSYFQDQADSLTFEKVRRLLEKDLGLETHALDTHKRFVKHWLQTCIESASPDNLSKSQADAEGKPVSSTEEAQSLDERQVKNEVEEPNSGDAKTMEDSPVMGLMTGLKKSNNNDGDAINKLVPTEITIKKAIWARAAYIRENSESITLAGLRRLLEEDLSSETHALDPFKKFISKQVDEVLNSPEAPQTTVSEKKKNPKDSHRKVSSKSSKEVPASSGNESDEVEEEEVRNKKRSAPRKQQKSAAVKKRQRTEESSNGAKRKQSKVSKSRTNNSSDEEGRDASEDDNSDASEKSVKKKEIPKPSYGKEVERLKSVIKSCGMSISPAVYKKVKQAPENKREACLIKELEEMLSKEGLSTNPSEKEIKDVKKMKERAKELEGIDLSNIVSSSRRRSTASFIPPPKPKIPDLSESESEESENDDDDDDEDEDEDEEGDEEVENEEVDEDQENGGNSSQSEESDKGNSDSD